MEVTNDPAVADETGTRANTNPDTGGEGETTSVQPQDSGNGDGQTGDKTLPPELEETRKQLLRDYHEKTQKLAEDKIRLERDFESLKSKSSTFDQLLQQDWFKKAAEAERSRRNGPQDLTDEQFEVLKNDKNAFKEYVRQTAETMIGRVKPEVDNVNNSVKELQTEREFDRVSAKYSDFKAINEKGLLDPYLSRGFDYETAYQKYTVDNKIADIDALAAKKAEEILKRSREGAISKGGTPNVNGKLIVKARNFDDAFDKVYDAIQKGQDVSVEREARR